MGSNFWTVVYADINAINIQRLGSGNLNHDIIKHKMRKIRTKLSTHRHRGWIIFGANSIFDRIGSTHGVGCAVCEPLNLQIKINNKYTFAAPNAKWICEMRDGLTKTVPSIIIVIFEYGNCSIRLEINQQNFPKQKFENLNLTFSSLFHSTDKTNLPKHDLTTLHPSSSIRDISV